MDGGIPNWRVSQVLGIGALMQLTQSLWNRFPGEQDQQDYDT